MSLRTIVITAYDKKRLELLIAETTDVREREDLRSLTAELVTATVVLPQEIPQDVVTMNSKVVLRDLESDEKMTYTLVFPKEANVDAGAISVLAPIGTAILGYRRGDPIEWAVPAGIRRIRIEDILYQPEAAGDFHR